MSWGLLSGLGEATENIGQMLAVDALQRRREQWQQEYQAKLQERDWERDDRVREEDRNYKKGLLDDANAREDAGKGVTTERVTEGDRSFDVTTNAAGEVIGRKEVFADPRGFGASGGSIYNLDTGEVTATLPREMTLQDALKVREQFEYGAQNAEDQALLDNANKFIQNFTAVGAGGSPTSSASQVQRAMVGQVVDGFRFKGGNPNDPKNWEPVK